VVMRADFAVASPFQLAQHVRRRRIDGNRIRDHVSRPDTVSGEQRVQPRERMDVLEPLIGARGSIPLIVAFGVDAN
jgi:hypothetical protein